MLHFLKELNSKLTEIQESAILDKNGNQVAWHCTTVLDTKQGYSGGFHKNLNTARKIAVSEFIERNIVKHFSLQRPKEWQFDKVPTGCGFAVGFNKDATVFRSLCEAIERWTLSKWIDENFLMEKVNPTLNSVSSNFFASTFENVEYYLHEIPMNVSGNKVAIISVGAVVAQMNDGIFLGSRASLDLHDVWEHALLEAYRHLLIFRNGLESSIFPFNRIFYFAKNKNDALKQINSKKRNFLPMPSIDFQRVEPLPQDEGIFIARTILSGGKPWHLGPVSRFLY
ncbi:MAG: hypothetical protein ACXVCY_17970 [Pseudobdellovibrionaceae bacterium]